MGINLIIGADIVATQINEDKFINADINSLIGTKLQECLYNSDFRIFNLEAPLTNSKYKIKKSGPNLKANPNTINGILALKPSLFTLANNHIMDYGEAGLNDTIEILKKNNIPFIGAGYTLSEAKKTVIFEKFDIKIGIYACTEHEFSTSTPDKSGANPIDLLNTFDEIKKLKRECDYLIVLYHGGKEYYRYPSPNLQLICHKFVASGASLVVCQHSHCIGCHEEYSNAEIIYGQGNFLFQKENANLEFWGEGMLIGVCIDNKVTLKYIPIVKNNYGIVLAEGSEKERILGDFEKRSKEILEHDFVEKNYDLYASEQIYTYLKLLSGSNFLKKVIYRYMPNALNKYLFREEQKLVAYDLFSCEAHRELIVRGLECLWRENKYV